ncbi:hypothetical protein [Inquilinus limosus]|nr:hypothetical protein [Inquilinus limosus]
MTLSNASAPLATIASEIAELQGKVAESLVGNLEANRQIGG